MPPKKEEVKEEETEDTVEEAPTNGEGKFFFSDEAIYEGEWVRVDGVLKKQGKGKMVQGPVSYEGDWEDDQMHGKGKFVFPSGATYEGDFVRNLFEGHGKYTWPNGTMYEGQWRQNQMHGKGSYHDGEGRVWNGTFHNGMGPGLLAL